MAGAGSNNRVQGADVGLLGLAAVVSPTRRGIDTVAGDSDVLSSGRGRHSPEGVPLTAASLGRGLGRIAVATGGADTPVSADTTALKCDLDVGILRPL